MKKVEILSPAKVNLHLEVGDVRPDGFHEITSLFQAVSLFDRMVWENTSNPGECRILGDFPCPAEDNLIYKAVEKFRSLTGYRKGVSVSVEKKIPHEAGLGGGSSNAAAALKAMESLSGLTLSEEDRVAAASFLGSDIPFFLYGGASAVTGRGEVVEPVSSRSDFAMVLVKPDSLGISTAEAYRSVDLWKRANPAKQNILSKEDMLNSYESAPPSDWPFYNTFFETFKNQYKPLEFISNLLYDSGAVFAGLSGSGSAVFGIFSSEEKAECARVELKGYFPFTERINPLNSIPAVNVI